MADSRKKYAIVGTGSRSRLYSHAILGDYKDCAELVALCDLNHSRMEYQNSQFRDRFCAGPFPAYSPEDFDRMIFETLPDTVIVTTMDRTHHRYICRAMELGCDVITEKPLTTDAEKAAEILETQKKTGKNIVVTFNYRYSPRNAKVKELLQSGAVGGVVSVHFEWMLDTRHGADYFRRWHRDKNNSGGLMVHKATHHFDLVNWWIDSVPLEVFGMGRLAFYGRENAEARGMTGFYHRAYGSENASHDPFALNLQDGAELENLYLKAEHEDGYLRDQSVFGHDISIEDTMSVLVKYRNKATLTYSLNAFCPLEGYRVAFNGTEGRLEIHIVERSYVSGGQNDQNNPDFNQAGIPESEQSESITLQRLWQKPETVTWEQGAGGHGGGDRRLLDDLFLGAAEDPLHTAAKLEDGINSVMVGIAANRSFATGSLIRIKDLLA